MSFCPICPLIGAIQYHFLEEAGVGDFQQIKKKDINWDVDDAMDEADHSE